MYIPRELIDGLMEDIRYKSQVPPCTVLDLLPGTQLLLPGAQPQLPEPGLLLTV
jgi:hypothetical protein